MSEQTSVLLASGGMDSTTLAYWLKQRGEKVYPLFIDYGQHCAATEWDTLRHVLDQQYFPEIGHINVADIYRGSASRLIKEANLWEEEVTYDQLYLPYRSLLLLSIGAAYAQSRGFRTLYAGFINSNHAQEIDCSNVFFNQLSSVLSDFGGIRMLMPFRHMTKREVAAIGFDLGVAIGGTFSCQAAASVPCGVCPNCVDRLTALDRLSASYEGRTFP